MTIDLFDGKVKTKTNHGIISINGFTAEKIKVLLEQKHSKDIFFTEVKNGPTWSSKHLMIMDAWVLPRTYSPLHTIGYEIKVSRQDFEQDQKWIDYLPLCHQFYFVCPGGLIRSTDLPHEIGLIWVSTTGKLHTKRIAELHEPDLKKFNDLLIYLLMARTDKQPESVYDLIESKKRVIEEAESRKELAYFVKSHIKKTIEVYKEKNAELSTRESDVKRFATLLEKIGITWNSEHHDWLESQRVENEINVLIGHIDNFTLENMKRAGKYLLRAVEDIEQMRIKNKSEVIK